MRKKRRKHISAGTVLLLALTASTLAATAWLLPKFMGSTADLRIDPQRLFGGLVASLQETDAQQSNEEEGLSVQSDSGAAAAFTPQPESTPSPVRMLSIHVAGSVTVPKNVRQSGYDRETDLYAYDAIFAEVRGLLSGADLTLCTVESTFTGSDYTDYNAPDAMLDALKFAGFNVVSLGNEHALNSGIEGLSSTVTAMESKGFIVAGATPYKEDVGAVRLIQVNDVQVAVLAYSYGISNNAQKRTRAEDRFAVPLLDIDTMRNDIANARKAGADLVIVMPHWGTRNSAKVTSAQKELGQALVAMGADLVVGAHPNVVQRVDQVETVGPTGKKQEAVVAYSLGSLLSDSRDVPNASSIVMHFDFQVDTAAKTAKLVRYGYVPIWTQRDRASSGYTYSILRADDEDVANMVDSATRRRMNDACVTAQKVLAEGDEVSVYWP